MLIRPKEGILDPQGQAVERALPALGYEEVANVHVGRLVELDVGGDERTVTARVEDAQRYRELLVEQLTAPVRFTQAARELVNQGVTTFVEVGPGNVLSGLLKRIDRSVKAIPVGDLASLEKLREILGSA